MTYTKDTKIFKKGSTTYYFSSIFFPPEIKQKVFALYAFVRTADNLVDCVPQDKKGFLSLRKNLDKFPILKEFPVNWTTSFLDAMQQDLTKKNYKTWKELEDYIYGSANVIGLMMAKLMGLPRESYQYAEALGKSMQLINFVRDIQEDNDMGRRYLLKQDALSIIKYINKYEEIDNFARQGFKYIPKKYLVPIKTASDMYRKTAEIIKKNPSVVFQKKVKPSKFTVIATAIKNYVTL